MDQALQLLANSDDWFGDVTFKICPEVLFQLYTVHDKIAGRALPCIYALLPNKQGFTYTRLFQHILAVGEPLGNGPSTMTFDFKKAAINAAENVFENAEISCCFFHLSSNIWKQIQNNGLQERYVEDVEFAPYMRMVVALAFVPPQDVITSFDLLCDKIRLTYGDDADRILGYFEDNYIRRFRANAQRRALIFPIETWNMFHRTHQEMPNTNNNIEGWHRRFASNLSVVYPGFWKFLNALKKEENLPRVDILQADGEHRPPAQRRRHVDCNARIIAILDNYPNRDRMNFLRNTGHNIGF